jgi:hypothetical protein
MSSTAKIRAVGKIEVHAYEPQTYDKVDGGPDVAEIRVTKAFHGDIEGEGSVRFLLASREDGSASFVGIERAIAATLAAEGAAMGVNHLHTPERAEEVVGAISASGGSAIAVDADISQRHQFATLFKETIGGTLTSSSPTRRWLRSSRSLTSPRRTSTRCWRSTSRALCSVASSLSSISATGDGSSTSPARQRG